MFIKELTIKNFRLFSDQEDFSVADLNIPDGNNEGSGLTIFAGENGCGKTTLLDALALPLLEYKTENITLQDFYNPSENILINLYTKDNYSFKGVMPNKNYLGKGFKFKAGIRTRSTSGYLSSMIVSDQQYIRADGETTPEDGKADLRINVNNPWLGSRFTENDIVFLDKNRTYQTRLGTYSKTRFDKLMGDFDYQYIKTHNAPKDLNGDIRLETTGVENNFLEKAKEKFEQLYGEKIVLSYIDNWAPHSQAVFSIEKTNKQRIALADLGSGYEIIFSLLYSFYLSKQSGKQLIILIDEPELHLHPKLQGDLVKLLLEFSKTSQIIVTTHSPLFVKQALYNEYTKTMILTRTNNEVTLEEVGQRMLSYNSSNEINFLAFGLATEEYHNELYEELKNLNAPSQNIIDFDTNFFQNNKGEAPDHPYNGVNNRASLHTFIRNQIHHRAECGTALYSDIKDSIIKMRSFF